MFIPEQNYGKLDKDKIEKLDCDVLPITEMNMFVKHVVNIGHFNKKNVNK